MGSAPEASTPATSAVIATVPRSGSWLLAEGLEATGVCGHPREYYRADYQPRYARAWDLPANVPFERYRETVLRAGSTPNGVFAVKVHWGQLEHVLAQAGSSPRSAGVRAVLEQLFPGGRFVFLSRRDKPRQAVSLHRAIRTDEWWALDSRGERALPALRPADLAEIERLEAVLTEHDAAWLRLFDHAGIDPLRLEYEEVVGDYEVTVRRVLAFLGLSADGPIAPPTLRRQAGAQSERWVDEYTSRRARGRMHVAR